MALNGFSESLAAKGVQTDLKVVVAADAGVVYMLGSESNYVQLASNAVSHVLDWDVVAGGIAAADVVLGQQANLERTDVNSAARLRPLAPGDTFRTSALQSTGTGGIDGTVEPNAALGVNPASGKIRQKQATDIELFRLAPDGGNTFNTDGYIWVEVTALR